MHTHTPYTDSPDFELESRAPDATGASAMLALGDAGPDADDDDDHSSFWSMDPVVVVAGSRLCTATSTEWAPEIVRYLTDHGLTVNNVIETVGAEPCWLSQRSGAAPALRVPMHGAFGATALRWTLAFSGGAYAKFAAPGSGPFFTIASPSGMDAGDICGAKEIAIAEGPLKAAAIASAAGMYAVAGHGVAFGPAAWISLKVLLGGSASDKPLQGRKIYVVADDGDLAAGHALVQHAAAFTCRRISDAGGVPYVVRHPPSDTCLKDINDLLRDAGPSAVRCAIENARRVVRAQPTPTKSVRQGTSVELLKVPVAVGEGRSARITNRNIVYAREQLAQATHLVAGLAKSRGVTEADVRLDPSWAERLGNRYTACGTGWSAYTDAAHDRVAQRRSCHALGCFCGPRRVLRRVHVSYGRLARAKDADRYQLFCALVTLGSGSRRRGDPAMHLDYLAEAQEKFRELRSAAAVSGGHAWQRTEGLYAPWAACVVAIGVTSDMTQVAHELSGWSVRTIGNVTSDESRLLAGWYASYGAWRLAPELSVEDRAACLLDEHVSVHRGSLVFGLVHGNALRQLEAAIPVTGVDATMSGPNDDSFVPRQRCPCGAELQHSGRCEPVLLRREGWTPRKRFCIAGPFGDVGAARWMSYEDATRAAATRAAIEAGAKRASGASSIDAEHEAETSKTNEEKR